METNRQTSKIENLNFTITMTEKCNLSCQYCPLERRSGQVDRANLDTYLSFFENESSALAGLVESIVFIFFGGEPLLNMESIKYFMEKAYYFSIPTRFVIYTNGLLINKEILEYLEGFPDFESRIIFYISIDGGLESNMKNRLKNKAQFDLLIRNIELIKEKNMNFSFSKVLFEKDAIELFESFKFLHQFKPEKLSFLPVSHHHSGGYSIEHLTQIIRGIDMFIEGLLREGYSELQIMEYFGLPDTLNDFKELYKADAGLYGDIDGEIYGIIDTLPIFSLGKTFTEEEMKLVKRGHISDPTVVLDIVKDYDNFELEMRNIGKIWHEREFPNEISKYGLLGMYFIKRLFLFKYKPQDTYEQNRSL